MNKYMNSKFTLKISFFWDHYHELWNILLKNKLYYVMARNFVDKTLFDSVRIKKKKKEKI